MENPIPKLTVGRIVRYVLSAADCRAIEDNEDLVNQLIRGNPILVGNTPREGEIVPAVVVVPWSDTRFNGQAFLDGNQNVWLTSVSLDQETKRPGTWHWAEFEPSRDKKVCICGVDCHKGDSVCNGYCEGAVDEPPAYPVAAKEVVVAPAYMGKPFGKDAQA